MAITAMMGASTVFLAITPGIAILVQTMVPTLGQETLLVSGSTLRVKRSSSRKLLMIQPSQVPWKSHAEKCLQQMQLYISVCFAGSMGRR